MVKGMGYQNEHTYSSYDGGLLEWGKIGNPVISNPASASLPIIHQVPFVRNATFQCF